MAKESMPKYFILMNWIKEQIAKGELKIGDKLLSENELGQKFEISRQTVRQATSVLENDGILERRRGSGTYVTSLLATPRMTTMNIGVITTYLDDYIFPGIIKGIENVLTENAYTMQLAITHNKVENETHILSKMLENGIDGIIVEPTKSGLPNLNADIYMKIKQSAIPCIFINGYYPNMNYPYVAMDDYACGKAAAKYLHEHNHTKIAGVFKSDDIQGHLRYAGCAKLLQQISLIMYEDNLMWYTTEDLKKDVQESFDKRVLARIKDCTAIIAYNDQIAVRLINLLNRHGLKVPEDISLISFDNSNIGVSAELTTFVHPKSGLGQIAARNLISMIRKDSIDATHKFAPMLVERASVRTL